MASTSSQSCGEDNMAATETTEMTEGSSSGGAGDRYQILKSLSDIQNIRDLTEDGIRDILRRHTNDGSLVITEAGQLEDMTGLNDAFNSCLCKMKVKAKYGEPAKEETFNFVIKSPPKMSFVKQIHKMTRPFFNEVCWYLDLKRQADLANGEGCLDAILPVCYHAYSSYYADENLDGGCCGRTCPWFCWLPCKKAEEGILILENIKMRERSYVMYDKRKPLPLDHVVMVMRELAHFHGKWLKWKVMAQADKLPKKSAWTFKTFEKTFSTQKRIPPFIYKQLKDVAKQTTIKILKMKGDEDENIAKCRNFFNRTAIQWLSEYLNQPHTPVHTLCHGDFWSNNILFTYNEDGSPHDLIIIDYQLLNFGHPAYDLVYFIYLNTDLEFRDSHLQDVLRAYYDTFAPYLKDNVPEDFVYNYENFLSDFNWHKSIGFTTACSVMPNVLSTAQLDLEGTGLLAMRELQQKQAQELADDTNESSKEIKRRIVGMVHEMARDGVI